MYALMFTVTDIFYIRIPTLSTASTLAALRWGWTARASLNNHRRVWPGVVALAYHWRAKPNNKIVRLAGQVVFDPGFSSWHPVFHLRGELAATVNFV